jgi:hypothetical protein
MNLNLIAEQDLAFTLEDSATGFGVDVVFSDGDDEYPVTLQTTDIGFFIDLQSGTAVQGRQVELNGRISTIETLAESLPLKSWTVTYTDTGSKEWSCGIVNVVPDRKLGIYKLILEAMHAGS